MDFSGFINFCGVDRDGYPMLADAATAVTNGLCSSLNQPSTAYWLLTAHPNTHSKQGKNRATVSDDLFRCAVLVTLRSSDRGIWSVLVIMFGYRLNRDLDPARKLAFK